MAFHHQLELVPAQNMATLICGRCSEVMVVARRWLAQHAGESKRCGGCGHRGELPAPNADLDDAPGAAKAA